MRACQCLSSTARGRASGPCRASGEHMHVCAELPAITLAWPPSFLHPHLHRRAETWNHSSQNPFPLTLLDENLCKIVKVKEKSICYSPEAVLSWCLADGRREVCSASQVHSWDPHALSVAFLTCGSQHFQWLYKVLIPWWNLAWDTGERQLSKYHSCSSC